MSVLSILFVIFTLIIDFFTNVEFNSGYLATKIT